MKVLYIINGLGFSKKTGIGGSDKRAIEIVRANLGNKTLSQHILTTISGEKIFKEAEKLNTKYYTIQTPSWWPDKINNYLVGRTFSYFYATIISILWYKKFSTYDIFYATSDFFFDILPGYFYKLLLKKKFVCMVHHYISDPFTRNGKVIPNILLYLSQTFSFFFIDKYADALLLYNTEEGIKIGAKFKNQAKRKSIYFVENGIDEKIIDSVKAKTKKYEACFVGGLRYSKGIREFTSIWKDVTKVLPNAKFLVIGGGSSEIVESLKSDIEKCGLTKNILLKGPLSREALFREVKSCKVFLFPSHEEGWGIVVCEAMYCKLPIICYDLPAFKIFGGELDKYKKGNWQELANKIIYYLKNHKEISKKGESLKNIASKFTWSEIGKKELVILNKIADLNNSN